MVCTAYSSGDERGLEASDNADYYALDVGVFDEDWFVLVVGGLESDGVALAVEAF